MSWKDLQNFLRWISQPFAEASSQSQRSHHQKQSKRLVLKREHLRAICDYYGVDPQFIIESSLEIYPIYYSHNFWVEYITGHVTVQTNDGGEARYYVRPKCFCPTCLKILHKPEKQFVGMSFCCGRLYCNNCAQAHQICGACMHQVCRYCGIILPFQNRLIAVHKIDCLDAIKPYLTENLNHPRITNQ